MSVVEGNGNYRLKEIERRLERIEAVKPDVIAAEIVHLSEEVHSLKRAFYSFAFSVVASALLFAATAFQVIGH